MSLDVVRTSRTLAGVSNGDGSGKRPAKAVYDRWKDRAPSNISHHGRRCCEIAGGGSRRLITHRLMEATRWQARDGCVIGFHGGRAAIPCSGVTRFAKTLSTAGHLLLSRDEVFTIRGVKSYRVQLVQRYSRVATEQWSNSWVGDGVPTLWLNKGLIYHEGCATVLGDNEIEVWDPSSGCWIDPKASDGYGALLALKVNASKKTRKLTWGKFIIEPNVWRTLE